MKKLRHLGTIAIALFSLQAIAANNGDSGGGGLPDCHPSNLPSPICGEIPDDVVITDPLPPGGDCEGPACTETGDPGAAGFESGGSSGDSSEPVPEAEQTLPPDAFSGSFTTTPPDPNAGYVNEEQGREAIDDALDFFGTDGVLAKRGGGAAEIGEKADEAGGAINKSAGGTTAASAEVSFGAKTKDSSFASNAYQTIESKSADVSGNSDMNANKGGDADKGELAFSMGSDRFGVQGEEQAEKFGGTGQSAGPYNERTVASTGEVGLDGPGGGAKLRAGRNGADEYLVRTGKLSLFEIVNRRYEIWGSQNLR